MNVKLKTEDVKKLKALVNIRNGNFKITEIYAEYLNNCPTLVSPELIEEIVEECSVSKETAFVSILSAACGFDTENDRSDRDFEQRYFIPSVSLCSEKDYADNEYLRNVKLPSVRYGEWELTTLKYKPYEGFISGESILCEDLTEIPRLGFFDREYPFPAVLQGGREWMAVKPNEIETMREPIGAVSGRVLTLGLGLGYFAYMASEKESVTEVTVIEKDKTVIELFERYILPQFKNREKIRIICADAFEFVERKMKGGQFDFLFADTWHDVSDGFDAYIRLKKSEKRFQSTKFLYWIERSLLSRLRWLIFDNLAEAVLLGSAQDGKGESIRSFDEVRHFLSDESLKKLAVDIRRGDEL